MSRPWKVPVGTGFYTVKIVQKLKAPDGDDVRGLTEYDKRIISLERGQSEPALALTFWHEYMHAVLNECGYNEVRDNEAFVEAMAQNLLRAIKAAPDRFKS